MAGYLFNLSPTKKTGTGQDVLEKHEEKERGTCVYCVHLYIVCLCYVPESVMYTRMYLHSYDRWK